MMLEKIKGFAQKNWKVVAATGTIVSVLTYLVASKYTADRIGRDTEKILKSSPELWESFLEACSRKK